MSAIIRLDMAREAIANEIYNTIMYHKDSSHYVLTNSIMSLLDKYSIRNWERIIFKSYFI